MRTEEQFDAFYLKNRRALVHQTFALTGDLGAAQRAVRDAYVAAWHHWRKVSAFDDPRDWVRPRAWQLAQRRHTARLWHRTKTISDEHRAVLDALHKLPVVERRALLLVQLAGVPLDVAAREINAPREVLERHLQAATASLAVSLDADSASVRRLLVELGEDASTARLPRAAAIRREGRRRRRSHTTVAAAAATFLAVASGAFAHEPASTPSADPGPSESSTPATEAATPSGSPSAAVDDTLPSADEMLEPADLATLAPGASWRVVKTHDNTADEGLNSVCQQARFADPDGLSAVVREFTAGGRPPRSLIQTMEVSASPERAATTYDTVIGWFAGCPGGHLQLQRTLEVSGIGDQAALLQLAEWRTPSTAYTVGVARTGQVVTFTVTSTVGGAPPATGRAVRTLSLATRRICEHTGTGPCVSAPRAVPVPAPWSGEEKGMLAGVDLPAVTGVDRPWVGTEPANAPRNPAATSCDQAQFRRAGATRTRTRTFLVPGARLPDRFGLTETYGSFTSARAAARFLATVRKRFATCEDRDLTVDVLSPRTLTGAGVDGTLWTLQTEIAEGTSVVFKVGFVRRGNSVAQVTFLPAGRADVSDSDFRALVLRAGDRLRELR